MTKHKLARLTVFALSLGYVSYGSTSHTVKEFLGYGTQSSDWARALEVQKAIDPSQTAELGIIAVRNKINPNAVNLSSATDIANSSIGYGATSTIGGINSAMQDLGGIGNDLKARIQNLKKQCTGDEAGNLATVFATISAVLNPSQGGNVNIVSQLKEALGSLGGTGAGVIGAIEQLQALVGQNSTAPMYDQIRIIFDELGGMSPDIASRMQQILKLVNGNDPTKSLYDSLNIMASLIGLDGVTNTNLAAGIRDIVTKLHALTGANGTIESIIAQWNFIVTQRIGIKGASTSQKVDVLFEGLQGAHNTTGNLQDLVKSINQKLGPNAQIGTSAMIDNIRNALRPFGSATGDMLSVIVANLKNVLKRASQDKTVQDLIADPQDGLYSLIGGLPFDGTSISAYDGLVVDRNLLDPLADNLDINAILNGEFTNLIGGNPYSPSNGIYQNLQLVSQLLKGLGRNASYSTLVDFINGEFYDLIGGRPLNVVGSANVGMWDVIIDAKNAVTGPGNPVTTYNLWNAIAAVQDVLWNANLTGNLSAQKALYLDSLKLRRALERDFESKSIAEIVYNDILPLIGQGSSTTMNPQGVFEILEYIMNALDPATQLSLTNLSSNATLVNSLPYVVGGTATNLMQRIEDCINLMHNGDPSVYEAIQKFDGIIGGNALTLGTNDLYNNLQNIRTLLLTRLLSANVGNVSDITALVNNVLSNVQLTLAGLAGSARNNVLETAQPYNGVVELLQDALGSYGSGSGAQDILTQLTRRTLNSGVLGDLIGGNKNSINSISGAIALLRNTLGYPVSDLYSMMKQSVMPSLIGNFALSEDKTIVNAIQALKNLIGTYNQSSIFSMLWPSSGNGPSMMSDLVPGPFATSNLGVGGNTIQSQLGVIKGLIQSGQAQSDITTLLNNLGISLNGASPTSTVPLAQIVSALANLIGGNGTSTTLMSQLAALSALIDPYTLNNASNLLAKVNTINTNIIGGSNGIINLDLTAINAMLSSSGTLQANMNALMSAFGSSSTTPTPATVLGSSGMITDVNKIIGGPAVTTVSTPNTTYNNLYTLAQMIGTINPANQVVGSGSSDVALQTLLQAAVAQLSGTALTYPGSSSHNAPALTNIVASTSGNVTLASLLDGVDASILAAPTGVIATDIATLDSYIGNPTGVLGTDLQTVATSIGGTTPTLSSSNTLVALVNAADDLVGGSGASLYANVTAVKTAIGGAGTSVDANVTALNTKVGGSLASLSANVGTSADTGSTGSLFGYSNGINNTINGATGYVSGTSTTFTITFTSAGDATAFKNAFSGSAPADIGTFLSGLYNALSATGATFVYS